MTKAATVKLEKAKMIHTLATSDKFVERAILALFERQTNTEKEVGIAICQNSRGFSGVHAGIMSSFAEWILKSHRPEGKRLTPKQILISRRILSHYSGQLIEIRDERRPQQLPLAKSIESA